MMIDIRSAENGARKFLQKIILFIGRMVRANDSEFPISGAQLRELFGHRCQRDGPGNRAQLSIGAVPQKRSCQPLRILIEIEGVAALHAQKFAIHARAIAIVGANDLSISHSERGFAAVRAMRADSPDVLHLPGTRLIAIAAGCQRAHWADVDASAAFIAFEMVTTIRNDLGSRPAISDTERVYAQAFTADAHTAVTKDAARRIVKHNRRPLLFI